MLCNFEYLHRYLVIRSVDVGNHRLIPLLRAWYILAWLVALAADSAGLYVQGAEDICALILVVFWITYLISHTTISIRIVQAFAAAYKELKGAKGTTSIRGASTRVPETKVLETKVRETRALETRVLDGKPALEKSDSIVGSRGGGGSQGLGLHDGKGGRITNIAAIERTSRHLRNFCVALGVCDACALTTYAMVIKFPDYEIPLSQIAEAWFGLHIVVESLLVAKLREVVLQNGRSSERDGPQPQTIA
ncbi:hypothetical protein HK104_008879 [Borealophlyctis nickersoniae]|nr:hypothetical protein HK104_008879 [Borealophlyctis nickersoniae]